MEFIRHPLALRLMTNGSGWDIFILIKPMQKAELEDDAGANFSVVMVMYECSYSLSKVAPVA